MKKKNSAVNILTFGSMSIEQIEQFAVRNFNAGKLRIARDAFKELVRIDRSKYLPGLLKCYNLLAEQMAAKGQQTEARNLIEYIKELGGEKAVTVRLDLIENRKKIDSYNDFFYSLIKDIDSGQSIPVDVGYKAADYAVCKEIKFDGEISFFKDCLIVRNAITALCSEKYSDAVELIRPLSFDSLFSQWKLLLRGMIAFYTGGDEKAEKTFRKIESSTVPSEIAGSFLILLDKKKYLKKDMDGRENALVNSCVVAGYSDYKSVLPRAEYLWMVERYRDSFIHVVKNLSNFPTLEIGITGDLTNFFFNIPHHIEEEKLDKYLSAFNEIFGHFKGKFTLEILLFQRTASILNISFDDGPENEMLKMWELFIKAYKSLFGENKELEAEIYLYLGLLLSQGNPENQLRKIHSKSQKKHLGLAEKCLLKSMELNKSKDACIALLKYYKMNEIKKEFGALIDSAIEIYPDDKDLICEAGYMAHSRKAFNKCIEYFERAYSLDPIDSQLRETLAKCYINAARSVITNKNGISKMRKFMDRTESLCQPDSRGFTSGLRFVVVRRAALEFFAGNDQKGNEELQRAFNMSGKREHFLYFSIFIFRAYGVSFDIYKSIAEEVENVFSSPAKLGLSLDFIEVLEYTRNLQNLSSIREDVGKCLNYFLKSIENEFPPQKDLKRILVLAQDFKFKKEAGKVVKKALNVDPGNPLYIFYDYYFKKKESGLVSHYNNFKVIDKLKSILETARKRNDQETVALVIKEIQEINSRDFPSFMDNFPFPIDERTVRELDDLINNSHFTGDDFDILPQRKGGRQKGAGEGKNADDQYPDFF